MDKNINNQDESKLFNFIKWVCAAFFAIFMIGSIGTSTMAAIFFGISAWACSPLYKRSGVFKNNVVMRSISSFVLTILFFIVGLVTHSIDSRPKYTPSEEPTVVEKTEEISTETPAPTEVEAVSEEPTEAEMADEFPQIYLDFFEPYAESVGKLLVQDFQQANETKLGDYDVTVTEGNEDDWWTFKIVDENDNNVYMSFFPSNDMYGLPPQEWDWNLSLIAYQSGNKEIAITNNYHEENVPKFYTSDKYGETPNQEVKNLEDLEEFMFKTEESTAPETEEAPTEPITESLEQIGENVDDLSLFFYHGDVRNDVTGKWRYAVCADAGKNIAEYAVSYYNKYMSDDEIHAIINFSDRTTTQITKSAYSENLYLTVYEYVDGEEHDAKLMFSGEALTSYIVNLETGEITAE